MSVPIKSTLFTWNSEQLSGIEFAEKALVLSKKSILVGKDDDTGEPVALTGAAGVTDLGKVLKLVTDGAGDVKVAWAEDDAGHTQNTDTGTTSETFDIDSDNVGVRLQAIVLENETNKGLAIRKIGATEEYRSVKLDKLYSTGAFAGTELSPAPVEVPHALATKKYVDDQIVAGFTANDAMVFKGTVANAAALPTTDFKQGWTYRATGAFTLGTSGTPANNITVEVGDLIICYKDHDVSYNIATNVTTYWTSAQTNIDGAVTAAAALTDNALVIGDGGARGVETFGFGTGNTGKFLRIKSTNNELEWAVPTDTTYSGSTSIILDGTSFKRAALTGDVTAAQNSNATTISDGAVTFTKMVQSGLGGLSVIGRSLNTQGSFGEIIADTDKRVLTRYGNELSFTRIITPMLELIENSEVSVPTAYNVGAGGYIGQMTIDNNFIYVCTTPGASGTARWVRWPVANMW